MDRSRSKRYYYDHQDYDSETPPRSKQRYNNSHGISNHHYNPRCHVGPVNGAADRGRKVHDPSFMVNTSYCILCYDMKVGRVVGKSGSIIKAIRQHTGAWINVHELIQGDEERIIEITDTRRRDREGKMPSFSPAQEALFLIHERILESDAGGYTGDDDVDYRLCGGGGSNKVATRLVVSKMHVGCLLGKGGKIIEQMKMETKTHIRILPRDHSLPRCIALSDEIVQVVGDMNAVKKAISIISSRLRESQHCDRTNILGRQQSPERFFPLHDDFVPHMNNALCKTSVVGFGSRSSDGFTSGKSNNYNPHPSGYEIEYGFALSTDDAQLFSADDLVFQILCPVDKVDSVVGESHGIIELLQNEIGVDVKLADPVAGSNEQIIIISSEEGPDDDLFPAQEALLHIQTRIVDLVPEKENIITTRLVVPFVDIGCLDGRGGSLAEMMRLTGANIQILHREELPVCVSAAGTDEIVQIVGEIKASREALVEVTSRLRNFYIYQELFQKDIRPPPMGNAVAVAVAVAVEATCFNNVTTARGGYTAAASETADPPPANYRKNMVQPEKDSGGSLSATVKTESGCREDMWLNRFPVSIVTRSILEVVIPQYAVPKLITNSKNKLFQISELSGAGVKLLEDRPETTEKTIQISGTPEQVERAQSLLHGFILSTQEDVP